MPNDPDVLDKLVSLCKRRGFVFQSSEIYGGTGSVWDYGPLGVELKRNIKERWWNALVRARDDIEGLDAAILMHPKVWEASGHVAGFTDPLVDCRNCKKRFRADDPKIKGKPGTPDAQCPACGMKGTLSEPRLFNLMFKTFMGPVEDSAAVVYLRPETAQGIYVNFLNVQQSTRQKVPFGIAQIGKAFRNEITPGNFIFRTREFEQMEMQFFVDPEEPAPAQQETSHMTHMEWFEYWKAQRMEWHRSLGLNADRLQFHQHSKEELAHYARAAFDIQFDFGGSLGFQEVEGVHHRGDFDLARHQEYSGKKLEYIDQVTNRRFLPYVIETSVGADRTTLAVLVNGYREEEVPGEQEGRTVLGLNASLAPIKAGVFPLVKKDGMPEFATKLAADLRRKFPVFYDESGAIGRRYRRQDEVGTPFCVTIDGQTTQDSTVTIRDRDTLKQDRVAADQVASWILKRLDDGNG
jgi:glycyl-tRNA synthetase